MTGSIREAGAFRQENGRTIMPLRIDPCGSVVVVFRKPTRETGRHGKNWLEFKSVRELNGAWTVAFDPQWFYPSAAGLNASAVVFGQLSDWSKRLEPAIKYYSGTATYRKVFNLPRNSVVRIQ